jgi:hypothetical protein
MYAYEYEYELEAPKQVQTLDAVEVWCKALSMDHFGRFDAARMRNAKCRHETIYDEEHLFQILKKLHSEYRIGELWLHCVSGVYVDEINRELNVVGFRLFNNADPSRMIFIYFPLLTEIKEPQSYFMARIESELGKYAWRPLSAGQRMYVGYPRHNAEI